MPENDKIALQKTLTEWHEIRQSNYRRIDALRAELGVLERQNKKADSLINLFRRQLKEK